MLNMVGVGPFLTVPLVIGAMGGPQAMIGWAAGALIALCDGLVWAELGAALPRSGGSYAYLLEGYGPATWGRLFSFLFLAQTVIAAPLTAASGAVGFAEYAGYLVPALSYGQSKAIAVAVCALSTWLLFRNIQAIGKISTLLTGLLLGTMGWIIVSGATHFNSKLAFDFPPQAFHLSNQFFLGLGAATLIAMYDYSGYFNVCLIGSEIKDPGRNIPRCILLSIVLLGACYTAMSLSIIGVLPWREVVQSQAVVSDFAQRVSGPIAARSMTILVLVAAFASVYTVLLGYSRVPHAAAVDGAFFSAFAKVHPTRHFPTFSVLALGAASAVACFFALATLIKALLVVQIMTQFVTQCLAVILIRQRRPDIQRPFSMWLYPVPALIASLGWIFILVSSGPWYVAAGLGFIAVAAVAFLYRAHRHRQWPRRILPSAV